MSRDPRSPGIGNPTREGQSERDDQRDPRGDPVECRIAQLVGRAGQDLHGAGSLRRCELRGGAHGLESVVADPPALGVEGGGPAKGSRSIGAGEAGSESGAASGDLELEGVQPRRSGRGGIGEVASRLTFHMGAEGRGLRGGSGWLGLRGGGSNHRRGRHERDRRRPLALAAQEENDRQKAGGKESPTDPPPGLGAPQDGISPQLLPGHFAQLPQRSCDLPALPSHGAPKVTAAHRRSSTRRPGSRKGPATQPASAAAG